MNPNWKTLIPIPIFVLVVIMAAMTAIRSQPVDLGGQRTFNSFTAVARAPDSTVTNASSRVALGAVGQVAWVCNTGANIAYVAFGDGTVVVTAANGIPILNGACASLSPAGGIDMAAITATATTTLQTTMGYGRP